jgi:very-short-patch-repair endonuclease
MRGTPSECGVLLVVQAKSPTQSADAIILSIARRQHGTVARWQLLAAGVTREAITTRLRDGRLRMIHQGVYLVGAVQGEHSHAMAALLAFKLKAVLSHRTAASLWNLLPYPATAKAWVTIPPERSASRPRIKAIRAILPPKDTRKRDGLRLTSPPRTVLDMASLLVEPGAPRGSEGLYELEWLITEAQFRGIASEHELRDQLKRNPFKRGAPALRSVLDLPGGPKRTRSKGERAMLRLLREHRIDGFETNAKIHGYEVDFLWRDEGVVVELDGYDGHSGRIAFERDRLKWASLSAQGLLVLPVTGRQIRNDPKGVIGRLLASIGRR